MASVKSKEEIEQAVCLYGDMLMKVCLSMLGNRYDAEEIVQETFISYITNAKKFREDEHEKAWLLRVAINKSKNFLRNSRRRISINLDDIKEVIAAEEKQEQMVEILQLPPKIKVAIHLHYYEGYTCKEIGTIVGATESAVKKRLQKGRELLKDILEMEGYYEGSV